MTEVLSLIRIAAACAILAGAAASDLKTRRVSNNFWLVMGLAGIILLGYQMMTETTDGGELKYQWSHFLIFVAIGIPFFYAVLADGEEPTSEGTKIADEEEPEDDEKINYAKEYMLAFLPLMLGLIPVLGMVWVNGFDTVTLSLISIYAMVFVAYLFFYTGLLHGGADAKAFMAIAILIPFYPLITGELALPLIAYPDIIPLEQYAIGFPFVFLVFMNAAIINVLIAPIISLPRNLKNGDFGMKMFFGYRMNVDEVMKKKKFVWPMEVVRNGEIKTIIRKVKDVDNIPKEIKALKEMGVERIWVQAKYPFIVAILFGLLFSFLVGNLLMLIYI